MNSRTCHCPARGNTSYASGGISAAWNVGSPRLWVSDALKHLVKARERQRKKRGLQRRHYGKLSYKLVAVTP